MITQKLFNRFSPNRWKRGIRPPKKRLDIGGNLSHVTLVFRFVYGQDTAGWGTNRTPCNCSIFPDFGYTTMNLILLSEVKATVGP